MSRGLDAATITALAGDFDFATLVQIDLQSTIRITDWARNVSDGTNTFVSSINFLGVETAKETAELRVNELTIALSGAEQSYISLFFNNDYLNRNVRIWRAVMAADAVVGSPIEVFNGYITGASISEDNGESTVNVKVASHFGDFEKLAGRRTNPDSQHRFYPSDNGFTNAAELDREIVWGRK